MVDGVCSFVVTMEFLSYENTRGVAMDAPLQRKTKRDMDLADASLLWLAHETGLREIMTVDAKDFARYRLPGREALTLL
jgi:predicted nucleic acid-binding protein